MVVDTGESCHSLYEPAIMKMAMEKQIATMITHAIFAVRDLAVEIYTKPWIVELSRKSRTAVDAILSTGNLQLPKGS